MQYGLTLPLSGIHGDVQRLVVWAQLAEEAGWDGVFLEDYITYWGGNDTPTYDPWLTMTAIAMRTQRVRLGITVTPLSRRRPWKLAREALTLDQLSQGRLIIGFGLGDGQDSSFTHFGEETDPRRRAELLDEGLDVLAGLISGEAFSYQGKHYQVQEITFRPRSLQQPRIPIWIGGFWPRKAPARRAARWDGFCVAKLPDEHGEGQFEPADMREILAFIQAERSTPDAPFDLITGGSILKMERAQAIAHVASFAVAGATWWCEFALPQPGEEEALEALIRQGPPRG